MIRIEGARLECLDHIDGWLRTSSNEEVDTGEAAFEQLLALSDTPTPADLRDVLRVLLNLVSKSLGDGDVEVLR